MDAKGRGEHPKNVDEPLLLDMGTASRRLSISRSRAYRLARRGELPGLVRLAGTMRVSVRLLDEWLDAQRDGEVER